MRDTGICPNCSSDHIIKIKVNAWSRSYEFIYAGGFTYIYPAKYICTDCGYIETYIDNPKHLDKLRKKFPLHRDKNDEFV